MQPKWPASTSNNTTGHKSRLILKPTAKLMNKTYILPLLFILGNIIGLVHATETIQYYFCLSGVLLGVILGQFAKKAMKIKQARHREG